MNYVGTHDYEQRTAGLAPKSQTIQAWKTKKPTPPQNSQFEIMANLQKAQTSQFDQKVDHALAYAPQKKMTEETATPFQFSDVIDVVNPLHHLPLVGMAYRGFTNDKIGPAAQVIGGALYGGVVGAVTGTVNAITKMQTGRDVGEHILNFAGLNTIQQSEPNSYEAASYYQKAALRLDYKREV